MKRSTDEVAQDLRESLSRHAAEIQPTTSTFDPSRPGLPLEALIDEPPERSRRPRFLVVAIAVICLLAAAVVAVRAMDPATKLASTSNGGQPRCDSVPTPDPSPTVATPETRVAGPSATSDPQGLPQTVSDADHARALADVARSPELGPYLAAGTMTPLGYRVWTDECGNVLGVSMDFGFTQPTTLPDTLPWTASSGATSEEEEAHSVQPKDDEGLPVTVTQPATALTDVSVLTVLVSFKHDAVHAATKLS